MWRVGFPTPKVREYNEQYSGLDGDIWGDEMSHVQMMGWSKKGRKMIYMMGKGPRHKES